MMAALGWGCLVLLGSCYAAWILLLAVQPLMHAREQGQLPYVAMVLFYPAFGAMLLLHFLLNVLVLTLLLGELPREWLAAQRLRRLAAGQGLAAGISRKLLAVMIDPFVDPSNRKP